VVICPSECGRGGRIVDQVKALCEPGRIQECLVDAHWVHVGEACGWLPRPLVHWMTFSRIQCADVIPGHARAPDRMTRQVRVHRVTHDFTVDLEIGVGHAVVSPQRMLATLAEIWDEILLPDI